MKRLTLFSKICLFIIFIAIIFGIWWSWNSFYYINSNQMLFNTKKQIVVSNNNHWYYFNCLKFNIVKIQKNNNFNIPIIFQLSNGKIYHSNILLKLNIKDKFYTEYTNVAQYILYNIQYDLLDYSSTISENDIYLKRKEHKQFIHNILNTKISKDLMEIKQFNLEQIHN